MPAERRVLDVRALASTREIVACQGGGLFPVLAVADSGAVIGAVRGGAGHLGLAGRIEVVRSLDAGATWSPPAVVADSERDDRNPAVGRSRSGLLVLAYQRQGRYDGDGVYSPDLRAAGGSRPVDVVVTRSADSGLTWEPPAPLGIAGPVAAGSPFGKIATLGDGTMLLAIYGPAADGAVCSNVVRSTDEGATWGEPSLVARDVNETALLALPGKGVLAVLRSAGPDQALFGSRSRDGGRTWSGPEPITRPHQHPADLVDLASGDILLTYGNRTPPYRIEGLVSSDGGASWGDCLLTFSGALHGYTGAAGRVTDLGYPSTVIRRSYGEGRGVTMYYFNPSSGRDDSGEPSHLQPPYLADGYRAIAVTWREEELIDAVARTGRRR